MPVTYSQLHMVLEQRTFEMSYGCAGEDDAGKEGEAGNAIALSMQPDAASRRRSQQTCDRSNVNCSNWPERPGSREPEDPGLVAGCHPTP